MRQSLAMLLLSISFANHNIAAKDFVVFSVMQDLPMGEPNEVLQKNYYINMGMTDGVKEGTVLDIYRGVLRSNPYQNNQQHNLSVKIGRVKVIHSEASVCIAQMDEMEDPAKSPVVDVKAVMIGDKVKVAVD